MFDSTRQKFKIIGHRIFGNEAPPNTLDAVVKAAGSGIQGIETDVFLSKDNTLWIVHGDSEFGTVRLRNISQPEGPWETYIIGECNDSFLENMCYHKSDGHKMLKLREILPYFKGNGQLLNIEIKELDPAAVRLVIDEFKAQDMISQLFMSSFHHYHRKLISEYSSTLGIQDIPFGFLTYSVFAGTSDMLLSQAQPGDRITLSNAALRRYINNFPELFAKTSEKGIGISVWFDGLKTDEIETLENYTGLIDLGIVAIISNCPTKALSIQGMLQRPLPATTEMSDIKEQFIVES